METQRDFCNEILQDLNEARDELFSSLEMQLKDLSKFPRGEWFDKQCDRLRTVYTAQMHRILAMEDAIQGRLNFENFLLKRARVEHGLSQTELAKKAGVSRQWISYLEAGEVHPARKEKVSKKLKLRVCEILEIKFENAFPVEHLLEMLIRKERI